MNPSLTERVVRNKMRSMFKALTKQTVFIPKNLVIPFKIWANSSCETREDMQAMGNVTHEILVEMERRLRWVREELDSNVFKRNGGTNG